MMTTKSALFCIIFRDNNGGGGATGEGEPLLLPTDAIDDEETFMYKQNFLQNELNKQNFIYTIDKYRAVFSSEHIIALKVLSRHPHPSSFLVAPPHQLKTNANKNNNIHNKSSTIHNNGNANRSKVIGTTSPRDSKADQRPTSSENNANALRLMGKFRFLNKSQYTF